MDQDFLLIIWSIFKDFIYYCYLLVIGIIFLLIPIFAIFEKKIKNSHQQVFNQEWNNGSVGCIILILILAIPSYFTYNNYTVNKNYTYFQDQRQLSLYIPNGVYMNIFNGEKIKFNGNKIMYGDDFQEVDEFVIYRVGNRLKYCWSKNCNPYQHYFGKCRLPLIYDISYDYEGQVPIIKIENEGQFIQIDYKNARDE